MKVELTTEMVQVVFKVVHLAVPAPLAHPPSPMNFPESTALSVHSLSSVFESEGELALSCSRSCLSGTTA